MERKKALGKRIQDIRQARGWGVFDLSVASRINQSTIYRVEAGKSTDIDNIVTIARALDVTVGELLGEAPPDLTGARELERIVMGLNVEKPLAFLGKLASTSANTLRLVEALLDAAAITADNGNGEINGKTKGTTMRLRDGVDSAMGAGRGYTSERVEGPAYRDGAVNSNN